MKIEVLRSNEVNTGHLASSLPAEIVEIKRGRYIKNDVSHPLFIEKENYFSKIYCLEYNKKHIYFFNFHGNSKPPVRGIHVGLTNWQNQKFLWLQNKHWLQKEESIRYIINIIFLIVGVWLSFKSLK